MWQTVWLEPVGESSIESLKLTPNIDQGILDIGVQMRGASDKSVVEVVFFNSRGQLTNQLDPGRCGDSVRL